MQDLQNYETLGLAIAACIAALFLLIQFRRKLNLTLFTVLLALILALLFSLGILGHWKYSHMHPVKSNPTEAVPAPSPAPTPESAEPEKNTAPSENLKGNAETQKQRIQDFLEHDFPQ